MKVIKIKVDDKTADRLAVLAMREDTAPAEVIAAAVKMLLELKKI